MVKFQRTSEIAKLSIAALLLSISISAAQEVPAVAAEAAPVAEPVAAPVEAPVVATPAPAPAPAPVVVAVAEPAPAPKPEALSTTVAGTKISLYGRLELNSAYETSKTNGLWSGYAPKKGVVTDASGETSFADPQGRTSLSIARTRLGLNLEGPSKDGEPSLKGKFEADFAGNAGYNNFNGTSGSNSGFRVRQSWGSLNFKDIGLTILFGQTDDLFTPLDPPSINPSSFNAAGNLGNRRPQIRLTQAIGPVEIAVAATHDRTYGYVARKDPEVGDKDTMTVSDNNAPSSPAVQGRLGLKLPASWAGEKASLALGVGGLYGKNEAANDDDENRYKRPEPSYMFGVDLSLPVIDILTLTGEFFSGQNLSRYGDGSLTKSRAYGKVKGKDGSWEDFGGIQSIGWWAGLAAKLPANLSFGAGVGAETLDEDSKAVPSNKSCTNKNLTTCSVGDIESNMFVFANLAYNFTSAAKITFEWVLLSSDYSKGQYETKDNAAYTLVYNDNGRPEYDGKETMALNRFELNFRYDFK